MTRPRNTPRLREIAEFIFGTLGVLAFWWAVLAMVMIWGPK